jgi:ATP-dependent DNA helicase 2 subunit 2
LFDSSSTGLDNAKHALRLMVQQKLLFTKQDELAIVLVGTNETNNVLNENDPDSYQHVSVLRPLGKPDLSFLELIDSIDIEPAEGDVIDGLLVAMEMIHTRVKKLKFTKRIFLVTDAAGPIVNDPQAAEQ